MAGRRRAAVTERWRLEARLREQLSTLAMPCVGLTVESVTPTDEPDADMAVDPGSHASCVGVGAYIPAGTRWAVDQHGPMHFVAQINFAQLPRLPGFPSRGLLQWFVSGDDTYGLTFDETAGTEGFEVRWFDDPSAPSVGDATGGQTDPAWSPVPVVGRLTTAWGLSLPGWAELPADIRRERLWRDVAAVLGTPDVASDGDDLDPQDVYNDLAVGQNAVLDSVVVGSKVGGYAGFLQTDPRGEDAYPSRTSPAGRLILQLDSLETGGWGDGGIGHLFGDPGQVAVGDLTSIRYHWDCS